MGDRKYTGPTSGRITVGAGGVTRRETFTDPPLTAEETAAVAWFTALSPNEQLREVRRMKWNLDVAQSKATSWERVAGEERQRADRAERELSKYPPDGYAAPAIVTTLLTAAKAAGWQTGHAWSLLTERADDGTDAETVIGARLSIAVGHGMWVYRLAWTVDPGGKRARLSRGGLAKTPERRTWHDAPSVSKIMRVIEDHPSTDPE